MKMARKELYDRKAKACQLSIGNNILLLLPSDANKPILTWKGPFWVLDRCRKVHYIVDLETHTSLFHINMPKKFEERPKGDAEHHQVSVALVCEP
ncbi:hypothetical protein HPB50_010346 [Hyalomma asiaticum]|uniref:Uncharacterized protein n=1 Tax=Hyalomma asiaticum TaxID=266040 RepID=A0ACB7TFX8_HYAAI|nr:hypothetical protein HPB50_010346 [Hyalomma asiaticum]